MKSVLVLSVLAGLAATTAMAADIPDVVVEEAPVLASVYDWTGFYAGVHVGYLEGEVDGPFQEDDIDGGFAGIQGGYRWQLPSNVVLGVQVSAPLVGEDQEGNTFVVNTEGEFEWSVLAQAQLGYAFNRLLPFVTVGAGFAGVEVTRTGPFPTETESNTHGIFTAGLGANLALTEHITTGVRWNHVWSTEENYNFTFAAGDYEAEADTFTAVLEYKF